MRTDESDSPDGPCARDDDLDAADIPQSYFTWIIDGQVIAMHRPTTYDLAALQMAGVDRIISLSETPLSPGTLEDYGIEAIHMPIPDMSAPSIEQIRAFVRKLDNLVKTGHKVAVHCGAGLGRTGTMMAAYLVTLGLSAEDAMKEVRLRRPGSIESRTQEDAVRYWESHRKRRRKK